MFIWQNVFSTNLFILSLIIYLFNALIYIFRINDHKMDVRKPLKRNKSKQSCCVPDCNTPGYVTDNGKTVTFHVLTKDAKLLKIWIVKIGRGVGPLFQITSHTKIRSRHFIDSDFRITYRGRIFLKTDSIPYLFNRNNSRVKESEKTTVQQLPQQL